MTGEDLLGAVELLKQHSADQAVRPGHRPERKCCLGTVEDRSIEALCTADSEGDFGQSLVAPSCQAVG